jgi:hypothetical protein
MRRSSALFLLAAVFLLGVVPQALAGTTLGADSRVQVEIDLKAGGGFTAKLDSEGDRVGLEVRGHRQSAEYSVRGKVSESGIEARFGKLGEVSAEFTPTRTIETTPPPPGCSGDPWTTQAGFFSGTIRFRGERGYVEIDAGQARGTLGVNPDWHCSRRPARAASRADRSRPVEEAEGEGDLATLVARAADPRRVFGALAVRDSEAGDYTAFIAGTIDRREGMRIVRSAAATARTGTFSFDHGRGTAAVSPPWPFQGSASFRRDPHGPDRWRGSLRVPLLGAGVVALAGPGFRVGLKRDFPSE